MSGGMQRKWYEGPWVFVAGGCCLGCLVLPLACVALLGTGGWFAVTKNPIVKQALEIANESAQLEAELGSPIEYRWLGSSTQVSINQDEADLEVKIGGPKGTALLSGLGHHVDDDWTFERLRVRLEDGRVIDLLSDQLVPDDVQYEQLPLDELEDAAAPPAD